MTYQAWNLRINPAKCETILFSKPVRYLSKERKEGKNNFVIKTNKPGTTLDVEIPHKKLVKYLGVNLDYLLRLNQHVEIQLEKAKRVFKANSRIFHNRNLSKRAKTICYILLIRPISTYAAPTWWNLSASVMEKLRSFERKCLRACQSMYREQKTNFRKMVSNSDSYNAAKVSRIDCFIIKIIRDFYNKAYYNKNPVIKSIVEIDQKWEEEFKTGYIPPQAFTLADKKGTIQNDLNIPILYHLKRNKADKSLPNSNENYENNKTVYSRTLPDRDFQDFHRIKNKYWWLSKDAIHLDDLRKRARYKIY